jgi:hypothetical protein
VGGEALPVLRQGFGRGAVGQRGQQVADELGVLRGFELALGFERVAQAHQFFDAGDDAGLFGEGWQWNQEIAELGNAQPFAGYANLHIHDGLLNMA